jgi:hypothetical protein
VCSSSKKARIRTCCYSLGMRYNGINLMGAVKKLSPAIMSGHVVGPLELIKLTALMERTLGSPNIRIGLIDGPVSTQHVDLSRENVRDVAGNNGATCAQENSMAWGIGFSCDASTGTRSCLGGSLSSDCWHIQSYCTGELQCSNNYPYKCTCSYMRTLPENRPILRQSPFGGGFRLG